MLDSVLGGVGGFGGSLAVLLGAGGRGGETERNQALQVWAKIQEPNFDVHQLSAPELHIFAQEFPQLYDAVIPEDAKQAADSPELRQAQLRGLDRMEQVATSGLTPAERGIQQQGISQAMGARSSMTNAALEALSRRGALGGGQEIQARLAASANAGNMLSDLQTQLNYQNLGRRDQAISGAAGLAGQIRGQDVNQRQFNAEVQNRFNAMVAGLQNEAGQFNAQQRAGAQQRNVGMANQVGNQNQLLAYENAIRNQEYPNSMAQQTFGNQATKAAGISSQLNRIGAAEDANKAAREATIKSLGSSAGQAVGGGLDLAGGGDSFGLLPQQAPQTNIDWLKKYYSSQVPGGGYGNPYRG